jgi:ATP-binding cassette subfamily B protein
MWRAGAASVLNKVFDLAPPLLIGVAVDVVVAKEESFLAGLGITSVIAQLWVLAGVTFAIWGLESLFEYLYGIWWRNLAQSLEHELRMDAYRHTQTLEMAYFEQQHTGELMAVLNDDVNQLERFLDHGANDLIQVATTVVVVGAAFFVVAPQVAWLAFLPIPIILWGSFRFQRRIAPRYAEVRRRAGLINSRLANNLGGIATIKSFTAEAMETDRIAEASNEYRTANRHAIRLSSAFSPLIRMAIVVGFTATLVLGGHLVTEGRLDVGPYTVLVFLTQRLLWPLTSLGETVDLYHRAMASTARILNVLDTPVAIRGGDVALAAPRGEVAFRNVSFAYDPAAPTIANLTISIAPGETVGITGSTGSGKTTLIKLLLRFYDTDSGTVAIDGIDVVSLRLDDLRHAIGLVSQDVYLFDGSVADNIAYGRPGASRDDIVAAAAVAEAHGFIQQLPAGYDTVVGERGQRLSGGQRQRVSLARAVLKDPPILVLDEATSAVDNETEAAIQRSLLRLEEGRTTIIIAHRLSTIRHADRIHVLEGGRLVETGTHSQLTEAGGAYANLWRVQTGEAISHA